VWALTPEQIAHAKNEFNTVVGPGNVLLEGNAAIKVLSTKGLPNEELAKIWFYLFSLSLIIRELSDTDKDGKLNVMEYAIAQFLIYARLLKQPIPAQLPGSLLASLGSSSGTPGPADPWTMTSAQVIGRSSLLRL
jgi:hypothetical protein